MGCGKLNRLPCDGVAANIGHHVVDNFNPNNMTLKLENGSIKIIPELIYEMLGTPIGGTNLNDFDALSDDRPWAVRWIG